ncbi:MAG: hypothetical protein OHK93_000069 [Ramalina farinacea]|uniref:Rhodopsin domain-containing protein n=1 Tax=Ramalina farinacea TaxID=258253 RepID=A0AA43TS59_9LECA|nr:hypothetical protein [Ramalina farinacea]
MVLPLWMLRGLQITTGKRLGLVVIFSIGVVVIVMDVCRLALGIGGGVKQQATNFDALEPTVAVIVSALPVYRALLPSAGRSSRQKARHQYTSYGSDKLSWRGRIRSRQGKEAYELSEDTQDLHPDLTKPIAPDVTSENKNTALSDHRHMREEELPIPKTPPNPTPTDHRNTHRTPAPPMNPTITLPRQHGTPNTFGASSSTGRTSDVQLRMPRFFKR